MADPLHPTLATKEPAWLNYALGLAAAVVISLGTRWGFDLGDDQEVADGLTALVVWGLATWRTRRTVSSPATVAALEHWQTTGDGGGAVPKSTQVERPS